MKKLLMLAAIAVLSAGVVDAKTKPKPAGVKPVTSGVVVRGQTLPPPAGPAGTKTGTQCDNFKDEHVDGNGNMEGASVQCGNGLNLAGALAHLPARFNAYCVVSDASRLPGGARLIASPVNGNAEHCDLSAMKPKDAIGKFGGAIWR